MIEHTRQSIAAAKSWPIKSNSGYVDVESVRFTTDEIGIADDADLIKLTDQQVSVRGKLQTTDDILMSEATAALTHDAASGVGPQSRAAMGTWTWSQCGLQACRWVLTARRI